MGVLDGKVILITGSSRGFGLAIARACLTEGARVVVSGHSENTTQAALDALRGEGAPVSGQPCDVGDRAQIEALLAHALEAFGKVDVWVNNAGYAPPYGPTVEVPPGTFERTVQTNILGTYYGSRVALRHFLRSGSGKLINIMGRGSQGEASPMQSAYAASKAWVRSFTRSLAKEHAKNKKTIGVYAFNPGMMTTDFLTRLEAVKGYEARLRVMPTIIRMWANPPEVPAERVVWLASAATDGKTGLEIHQTGRVQLLVGALREGLGRLTRQPRPAQRVEVTTIPTDYQR